MSKSEHQVTVQTFTQPLDKFFYIVSPLRSSVDKQVTEQIESQVFNQVRGRIYVRIRGQIKEQLSDQKLYE